MPGYPVPSWLLKHGTTVSTAHAHGGAGSTISRRVNAVSIVSEERHGSVPHQPDVDSPSHAPQLDGQFQFPPLKRRKYKLDPPRQKNQFAYELMLSLQEEQ